MKKTILILAIILLAVPLLLAIFTSNNEYAAERLFYKASRVYNKIKANPDVAPPLMLGTIEKNLKTIIEKHPETETAKSVHIVLAEFYTTYKRYDEAIRALDRAISTYDEKDALLLSNAYFLKGVTYERQGRWGKALGEFAVLKDSFSGTPLGLQIPLYIAEHYAKGGRTAEAEREFGKAASFYEKLREEKKGTMLGYTSSDLLAQVYATLKRYEELGRVLEDIIIDYPGPATFGKQLPFLESIFVKKLNRPEKAIEIYNHILEKTQDEELKGFLLGRIEDLEAKY